MVMTLGIWPDCWRATSSATSFSGRVVARLAARLRPYLILKLVTDART